jgi:hypothetical protein
MDQPSWWLLHLLGGPGRMFPVVAEVLCHGTTSVGRQELQGSRLGKKNRRILSKKNNPLIKSVRSREKKRKFDEICDSMTMIFPNKVCKVQIEIWWT